MNDIIIASKNKGKIKEFNELFKKYKIQVRSLIDLSDIEDIEETGSTFEENASLKAEGIAGIVNKPVLADDSGLVIDALDGRPGVYSARYAGEPTDDMANMNKVLKEMRDIPKAERTARFISVLALKIPGKETIYQTGTCEGTITFSPSGENGFGYDPIFIPNGYTITMAEMDSAEKNKISHRSNALKKLEKWLATYIKE